MDLQLLEDVVDMIFDRRHLYAQSAGYLLVGEPPIEEVQDFAFPRREGYRWARVVAFRCEPREAAEKGGGRAGGAHQLSSCSGLERGYKIVERGFPGNETGNTCLSARNQVFLDVGHSQGDD